MDCYSLEVFWAAFEDGRGERGYLCLDLRKESATRGRLFDKARHPNTPSAVLLELGAVEEGVAIPLISHWLDSDQARKWLTDYGIEIFKAAFLQLGEPLADEKK